RGPPSARPRRAARRRWAGAFASIPFTGRLYHDAQVAAIRGLLYFRRRATALEAAGTDRRGIMTEDRILLDGMVFYGYHGTLPAERELGQRFVVDVALHCDLRAAGLADDLT